MMASTQVAFSAPKSAISCRLSSSSSSSRYGGKRVVISNRLYSHSIALTRSEKRAKINAGIDVEMQGLVPCYPEIENPSLIAPVEDKEKVHGHGSGSTWSLITFLAGGDMLALLIFSALGRLSHGLNVLNWDAFRTADPFIAGWLLGAYFLGGYGPDGQGANGILMAVSVACKSWAVGIPVGLIIKGMTSGKFLDPTFILVSMGSTFILVVGWRTLFNVFCLYSAQRVKKRASYNQVG